MVLLHTKKVSNVFTTPIDKMFYCAILNRVKTLLFIFLLNFTLYLISHLFTGGKKWLITTARSVTAINVIVMSLTVY